MSFNYGREEKKWRLWKEAEEKELQGYSTHEIAVQFTITEKATYRRIDRL